MDYKEMNQQHILKNLILLRSTNQVIQPSYEPCKDPKFNGNGNGLEKLALWTIKEM